MKILFWGILILPYSTVLGQYTFWDAHHVGSLSPLSGMPWLGNPAAVQPFSVHFQFQPTVPGYKQLSTWLIGQRNQLGWHFVGGFTGNVLYNQKFFQAGIASKINRVQLGGRMGLHALQDQDPDYPDQFRLSMELGAWYRLSSQWQTGFWAGGTRENQFWRVGLGYQPIAYWQIQTEWQGVLALSTQYAFRPGWQIQLGTSQKIFRTGIIWQSRKWTAQATVCRWPMGWISTLYSIRFQP